jgi:hypothetical protein
VSPGAARDLSELGRAEVTLFASVEFAQTREGDMPNVQIQPHADGVGSDQVVDLLSLVERHLRVPRARRKPTMNDGRPSAPVAQLLRDAIHLGHVERDDRAAARQRSQPTLAACAQRRQTGVSLDARGRHEPLDQGADGLGAQEPRLDAAARREQPIGEDVAALRVSRQLYLVDREEVDLLRERHGFDGADPIACSPPDALLFTRDQSDGLFPDLARDPIVHLARQETQR